MLGISNAKIAKASFNKEGSTHSRALVGPFIPEGGSKIGSNCISEICVFSEKAC